MQEKLGARHDVGGEETTSLVSDGVRGDIDGLSTGAKFEGDDNSCIRFELFLSRRQQQVRAAGGAGGGPRREQAAGAQLS